MSRRACAWLEAMVPAPISPMRVDMSALLIVYPARWACCSYVEGVPTLPYAIIGRPREDKTGIKKYTAVGHDECMALAAAAMAGSGRREVPASTKQALEGLRRVIWGITR